MKRGATGTLVGLALVVSALFAFPAAAQVQRAPGLKIGDGRLHPFLDIDGRFDSLVGYFNANMPSPELILHFRPGLKFDLDTPSTFVAFNGSGEYLWYTGALSPGSRGLSRFQANVGVDAKFNRDGAVEFNVGDSLIRSDRTQNAALGVGAISLFNNVYLAAPIHPGGRALEIIPKVGWAVEFFEPLLTGLLPGCTAGNNQCDPNTVNQSNYSNLNFGANARWKFLPKTALMVDVNADWRTYFAKTTPDKVVFRAQAGLAGLISPRIAVTLLAGYGGDFTNGSIHTFIGNAEFSYTVSEQSRIAVGYMRTVVPVPILGSMVDDRGYLRGGLALFGGRLVLNAQVSADYFTFLAQPTAPTAPSPVRNDFLLSAGAGPTVIITSWFDVSANYTFTFRTSVSAATSGLASLNFPRHEAILRLTFHY
ncbi:MAG: hypothetical protein U0228_36980 [Myxococcaceae bacterium]